MSADLPELIDPWRALETEARYAGSLRLARMARLRESLREAEGEARFTLAFSRDLEGRGLVQGQIQARLILTCQRCLEALDLPVQAPLALALVTGLDEARLLPEDLDPLVVTGESLPLADLIEDELLLALPLIPMHDPGACPQARGQEEEEGAHQSEEAPRPFAILSVLKGGLG